MGLDVHALNEHFAHVVSSPYIERITSIASWNKEN